MGFTTYPDTWVRDLPLLQLGEGAYVSNKATIGTNIAMADGTIVVDSVNGDGSLVGQWQLLPRVESGKGVEIGVGCAIGLKTVLDENVKVNPRC